MVFKYRAFISYSHADEKWAAWLHRALETYRIPARLVGKPAEFGPVPRRIAPIFRDREELASATSLGDVLEAALAASECLIVICSPRAVRSRWVNEEILAFKRLGREDRVFCFVVDGEPGASLAGGDADSECFPSGLLYRMGPAGVLTDVRSEPIAADVRAGKDSRQNAALKLIAGMIGVGFDDLKQRELHRRQRRMVAIASAATLGMAVTTTLATSAWFARIEADAQRVRAEAEAETAQQTARFMIDLFKVSDPGESLGNTITAREILDKGAARIDSELADQPAIQATLMDTIGTVYTSLGLYDPALALIERARDKRAALLGPDHAAVAGSSNHLGEVQTLKADYEAAERNLLEALETRRRLGVDADIAATLANLAELRTRQGRFEEAETDIRDSLAIRIGLYGPEHATVVDSREGLGLNFFDQGRYEEAVAELRAALDLRRRNHQGPHPAYAETMNNLAWALMNLGEADEAEALFAESLVMKRQVYEETHPEIASALNNIGMVRERRGDHAAAEAAYRESLALKRRIFGEAAHPEIARTLTDIAFVQYAAGRREAAIAQLREALDMQRAVLDANHPAIAGNAASLGYWLVEAGRHEEAEALVDEALAIRRAVYGENHPQVASTLTVKANLELGRGRFVESRDLASRAREILAAALPPGHWLIAAAAATEGAARLELADYAAAEPLLVDSLDALANAPIPGLEAQNRSRIVALYAAWGKQEEARKYLAVDQVSLPPSQD